MFQRPPIQNQHLMLITTNTKDRPQVFADPACAREAIESLYRVQYWNPFFLFGFVIMPDHGHFLLNVPEHGSISRVMQAYKRSVSFEIGKAVWQSRFHMEIVQSCRRVLNYIHLNPVRQNLCLEATAYPWSSASGRWDVCELPMMQEGRIDEYW